MYKLIAIDVDDTLINDDGQVTARTKRALGLAIKQGVTVTLATGRMYPSAQKIAVQTGLNVPLITYQGALIKNVMDGKVLYERYVPRSAVFKLLRYCEEHNIYLQLYSDDKLYAREENEKLTHYASINEISYTVVTNFDYLLTSPLNKVAMNDEPERLDRIAVELRELLGAEVHITKSKPYLLEVTHWEGTKGRALRHLVHHFGCNLTETIGIGDSWNDHDLIETAGLGVAMGNAVDSLKAIADYVTRSNNDEGVAHVIEKFVLLKSL